MQTLKLTEILPDVNQPRKYFAVEKMATLKDSISKHGIIQPLVVQKQGDDYLLIDGERRFRAATELKLKEVPVQIVEAKGDFERMVEQFHIQEQHESWTPIEKALAILEMSKTMGKGIKEVCELLSIAEKDLRKYLAFAELQNKERFIEYAINMDNAQQIKEMKNVVRHIKEEKLEESFTKADEGKLERAIVEKIKNGEIKHRTEYSRLKDSFKTNPKLIDKFINSGSDYDINETYIGSKAQGAAALRHMTHAAAYIGSSANTFMELKNVELTDDDIHSLKTAYRAIREVLRLVNENE